MGIEDQGKSIGDEGVITEVEQEKKEPTLEEQAAIYAEMYEVPVEQIMELAQAKLAEMSEYEKKEFTMLVFSPEGKTAVGAWEDVKANNPVSYTSKYINPEEMTTKGETDEAKVVFARYNREPDKDTLGDNAQSEHELVKSGKKWMSAKLRLIAGEYYKRSQGKHLDEKNSTTCPGSRMADGEEPSFYSNRDMVVMDVSYPGPKSYRGGARQVV